MIEVSRDPFARGGAAPCLIGVVSIGASNGVAGSVPNLAERTVMARPERRAN